MPEISVPNPIRGAIRTIVSTSTENLVAGEEFSIFITVHNPFEVPLILHRVSTYLPTEFLDVDKQLREIRAEDLQEQIEEIQKTAAEEGIDVSTLPIPKHRSKWKFLKFLKRISFFGVEIDFGQDTGIGPAIAKDMSTSRTTEITSGFNIPFIGGGISTTVKEEIATNEESKAAWKQRLQQELGRYQEAINSLYSVGERAKTLQPGNSTTQIFTVQSKGSILFKPSTYKLNIEVEYEIGGARNLDTIEHIINVRSSLASVVLGGLLGGAAGYFTSKGSISTLNLLTITSFGASLLLAAMIVVLLARKKEIQPLISVEDFWGGIATGFLAAYSGLKLVGL